MAPFQHRDHTNNQKSPYFPQMTSPCLCSRVYNDEFSHNLSVHMTCSEEIGSTCFHPGAAQSSLLYCQLQSCNQCQRCRLFSKVLYSSHRPSPPQELPAMLCLRNDTIKTHGNGNKRRHRIPLPGEFLRNHAYILTSVKPRTQVRLFNRTKSFFSQQIQQFLQSVGNMCQYVLHRKAPARSKKLVNGTVLANLEGACP